MTITLDSVEQFDTVLANIAQSVADADLQSMLRETQRQIAEGEAGDFSGQHAPDGSAWAPLAPSTLKRKKGNSRILFNTGTLEASLISLNASGDVNNTAPRELLFGTDVEYATFHETGTSRMPARPPLGLDEETLNHLVDQIADEIVRQLVKSGSE